MDELTRLKSIFFQECAELLVEVEETTSALASGEASAETLNALFRAVHSIKGGAGAFGFTRLVKFAHAYETVLDRLRSGAAPLTSEMAQACVRGGDALADLVAGARDGNEPPAGFEAAALAALEGRPVEAAPADDGSADIEFPAVPIAMDEPGEVSADDFPALPIALDSPPWRISFKPRPGMFERASEPLLIFRELQQLGALSVQAELSALAPLEALNPADPCISWTLELDGAADEAAIRAAFEFVEDECDLEITREAAPAEITPTPTEAEALANADEGLRAPEARPAASAPAGVVAPAAGSIRVDVDKIDRLVDMVGELVIAHAVAHQQLNAALDAKELRAIQSLEMLAQHMRGLQEAVMSIRAQPVKAVFSRMNRLVRDLSAKTGKKIALETVGDDVELDKSVLETLVDPLTHMIRNAADHGLETPEQRRAAGKPEEGVIRLTAAQRAGRLVVEIADDGRGINREKVLMKAIDQGLVAPDTRLSDEEIDKLIFRPGFSTAEQVSDLSGRGVGMDVVLQNIQKLGGAVGVRSTPGRGTTISLTLPLTLAVLDAMVVRVGRDRYVLPLAAIVETLELSADKLRTLPSGVALLALRGQHIPIVDVAQALGLTVERSGEDFLLAIVVETEDGARTALQVDDVLGQQQVVVKSLDGVFGRPPGVSGATILGDGRVALILDVADVRRFVAPLPAMEYAA